MAQSANLILSAEELQLVSDAGWIRMKDSIIEKVAYVFGELPPLIDECMVNHLPEFHSYCNVSPKISRGERYKGLPYLILDYPREFGKEDVFAIRTMFWWAHHFTISVHLAGSYKNLFLQRILRNVATDPAHLHLCINEDPWQHEISQENYVPFCEIGESAAREILIQHPFIKIAYAIPLHEWSILNTRLREGYNKISGLFA